MSKFRLSEIIPYARYFYGKEYDQKDIYKALQCGVYLDAKYVKENIDKNFDFAWNHHQKRNKHHWQYWLLKFDNDQTWSLQNMGDGYEPTFLCHNGNKIAEINGAELSKEYLNKEDIERSYSISHQMMNSLNRDIVPLPMPEKYCKEMLADWIGAGKALHGKNEVKEWYLKNYKNIILHKNTRKWIDSEIGI